MRVHHTLIFFPTLCSMSPFLLACNETTQNNMPAYYYVYRFTRSQTRQEFSSSHKNELLPLDLREAFVKNLVNPLRRKNLAKIPKSISISFEEKKGL